MKNTQEKELKIKIALYEKAEKTKATLDQMLDSIVKYEEKLSQKQVGYNKRTLALKKANYEKYANQLKGIEEKLGKEQVELAKKVEKQKAEESEKLAKKRRRQEKEITALILQDEKKKKAAILKVFDDARARGKSTFSYINKEQKKLASNQIKEQKDAAKKSANSWTSKFKSAFATLSRYAGAYAIINFAVSGVKEMVSTYLEVEKALYRVSAITGEAIDKTLKLQNTIYGVSSAYGIAAKDVARFMIEGAKLGKVGEDMKILAENAAQLSVLLGEDMAQSAKLLVTVMNQFKMTMDEAGVATSVFMRVISNSPMTVSELQTAFQYVGNVAYQVGLTLKETGDIIQDLSNSGLRASKIGTGLRNVMLKMVEEGKNFVDVMDDMAEGGINLEEVIKTFGLRGSTVAINLLGDWEHVRNLFKEDLPTDIERTATAMQTQLSTLAQIERARIRIINLGQGYDSGSLTEAIAAGAMSKFGYTTETAFSSSSISDTRTEKQKMRDYATAYQVFLNDISQSRDDFDKVMRKGISEGLTMDEIVKPYIQGNKIFESAYKDLKTNLVNYRNELEKEIEINKKRTEIYKNTQNSLLGIVREYRNGEISLKKAQEMYDETLSGYTTKSLESTNFKDIDEKIKKLRTQGYGLIAGATANETITQARKAINKIKEERKKLLDELESGAVRKDEFIRVTADLDKQLKPLCQMMNALGIVIDVCEKKTGAGTKKDNALRYLIDAMKIQYKNDIKEIDKASVEAMKDAKGISKTESLGLKEVLPFDVYIQREFGININDKKSLEGADKTKKEYAEIYKKYAKDIIASTKEAVNEAFEEEGANIIYEGFEKIERTKKLKLELTNLLPTIKDADKKAYVENEIKKLEGIITDFEKGVTSKMSKINTQVETANKDLDKKDVSVESWFLKLFGGENNGDEKDSEEKFRKFSKIVSNILSETVNLYKKANDELFNRFKSRIDAEMDSLKIRYDFEKDQLRLAAENNLITQEQYSNRSNKIEEDRVKKQNELAKRLFEAQKKHDIRNAVADGIADTAKALITTFNNTDLPLWGKLALAGVAAATIGAESGIRISAIKQREFSPITFAEGGIVNGLSHEEGGVPFTVNGAGGYEMEGGEFIVRKDAVNSDTIPILNALNNSKSYNPVYMENGGVVKQAQAQTVSVVAHISQKDLDAYERNRKIRENNKSLF